MQIRINIFLQPVPSATASTRESVWKCLSDILLDTFAIYFQQHEYFVGKQYQ